MTAIRNITNRQLRVVWVLLVVPLLSTGCHSVVVYEMERLIRGPVCPVCKAVTVDECDCFAPAENGGYCETTWTTLHPAFDVPGRIIPAAPDDEGIPLEEIPAPRPRASPLLDDAAATIESSWHVTDIESPAVQTAAYLEQPDRPASRRQGRGVVIRLVDRDLLPTGQDGRSSD